MSAPIRHLSIWQILVFLVNSRLGRFTAAEGCIVRVQNIFRHPFSRSYGVILPSSLTEVLPRVLEFSSCLPVSVCGTGILGAIAAFLGSVNKVTSLLHFRSSSRLGIRKTDLPIFPALTLERTLPSVRLTYPPASPLLLIPRIVQEFPPVFHRLRLSASP